MNHSYHNQTIIDAPEAYHQFHPIILLEQSQGYINPTFPIVPESTSASNSPGRTESKTTLSELKFKIESVGIHPKDDDDLDMCPARVRPGWPDKIIPWWTPINNHEKPPYSYATLIAHAILSSKDGRLTLNDIYIWISNNYPTFVLGVGGWQNSIRHNLSLNKKWFLKIDRRPTQTNPGKGCYWTLVAGKEHVFIDNLTQEGGHSRKHHDIGLTTELSLGQRRGACFYHPVGSHANSPHNTKDTSTITANDIENNYGLSTPPLTPTKPQLPRSLLAPLYTTFRMVSEHTQESPIKKRSRRKLAKAFITQESEYDSGVDLSSEYVECENAQKRCRTSSLTHEPYEACDTPLSGTFLAEDYFPPKTSYSSDWEQNTSCYYTEKQPNDINPLSQMDWYPPALIHSWEVPDGTYNDPLDYLEQQQPVTIDLNNDAISPKHLHFRQDSTGLIPQYYSPYTLYPSHPSPYVSMQDILYP